MYIRVCIVYKCTCCTLYSTLYCSIKVLAIRKIQNSWKSIEIKNLFNLIFTLRAYNFQMFVKFFSYILLFMIFKRTFFAKKLKQACCSNYICISNGVRLWSKHNNFLMYHSIESQTTDFLLNSVCAFTKKSLKNQGNLSIDKRTSFFLLLLKLEKILKFEASSAVSSVQSKKIFSR